MSFEEVIEAGVPIGMKFQTSQHIVFFGRRSESREWSVLEHAFPGLRFRKIKQVHGNRIVESGLDWQEADGHYTDQENIALIIETADCMPILMASPDRVIALHAGWRGVAENIIGKAASLLGSPAEWQIFIGPHILQPSFEIGRDVESQLNAGLSTKHIDPLATEVGTMGRVFYSLLRRAGQQFRDLGFMDKQIVFLDHDTKTNKDWASYRRDGKNCGRNFSFIARSR